MQRKFVVTNALRCLLTSIFILFLVSPKIAWPATAERAYIANSGGNTISVINTSNNNVVATIPVGINPAGVTINPAGTRAYVANRDWSTGTVSVIDTSSNAVITTIQTSCTPRSASSPSTSAVSPDGSRVYMICSGPGDSLISVIDASSNTETSTIFITYPMGVAFNPAGTRLYVTGAKIRVIDTSTNTVIANVGGDSHGLVFNSAGTKLYVAHMNDNVVRVYDSNNTVTNTINVGRSPMGIAINPSGTRIYVANLRANGDDIFSTPSTVSVIDTSNNAVIASVPVGIGPYAISVNHDGTRVYVTNNHSNTVSVIDTNTNTVIATVPVGTNPSSIFGKFIGIVPVGSTTTTTMASSNNPSTSGSVVTFTATVTPSTATGTVTFKDGATTLGTGTLSGGNATHSTSSLSAGTHTITAEYSGDNNSATSTSSALTQIVNQSGTTSSKAKMSSPPDGFTLLSTSQKFVWNQAGASEYRLIIGTSLGAENIYSKSQGTNNSVTVDNLPSNGVTLYVRLWSNVNGTWQSNDYTYKAVTDTSKTNTGTTGNTGNSGNSSSSPSCKSGTLYSATFLGGSSGSVCLSINKVSTPSGDSKLRGSASWRGFATTAGSADGSTFTFAWENYESDSNSGTLYENDPAHGALFILAYAFPSSTCSGGASFFAVIEMANAASMKDLGSSLAFTPLFGQICGTKITSLNSYTLTKQ